MKFKKLILHMILFNTFLIIPLMAQGERQHIFGIKDFEKSFPSNNPDWDSYDNLYTDTHYDGKLISSKLGLKTNDIIGKEMTYEYGTRNVDLVITSDSTIYWKDNKTGKNANQKTKTIHIDKNTMLVSWLEDDNTFVSMLSDFYNGKASAFLYKEDGNITPLTGSIKMKK